MTSSVRILSTTNIDSSPTILLVNPNGSKTIVNCGEGCQRLFLEYGQKISTVNQVCLTHLSHSSLGGLPGMILTTADVMAASAVAVAKEKLGSSNSEKPTNQGPPPSKDDEQLPGLDLIGPEGTQSFIRSLRHFMRRDAFQIRVHEGSYKNENRTPKLSKKQLRKAASKGSECDEEFRIQSIVCHHPQHQQAINASPVHKRPRVTVSPQTYLSYLFTTPPVQGKFLAQKAKALGIPPGPLYGKLKSGQSVSFEHPETGQETVVESSEVVEPGSPGVVIVVLYYPFDEVLDQLQESGPLKSFQVQATTNKGDKPLLELVIHMTSKNIFSSQKCTSWRASLGQQVEHIFLDIDLPTETTRSPFHSASVGATCRNEIASELYVSPLAAPTNSTVSSTEVAPDSSYRVGVPLMEYTIIPRSKKGFGNLTAYDDHWTMANAQTETLLESSGATKHVNELLATDAVASHNNNTNNGEILFTGTGSAIPCKHRNVSGIYLRMNNMNSMLLDIGEGTVGQLLRAKHRESPKEVLMAIRAVWVSHPHADHHLGILRLLSARTLACAGEGFSPLILIAPPSLRAFLDEYQSVDPGIVGSYEFLDCRDISIKSQQSTWPTHRQEHVTRLLQRMETELGVSSCLSVPVAHCAHSYAVVLRGTPFGSLAYSGDCRPSTNFASAAENADLLIHEATFTDGMEAEAAMKRHCTVGEALQVSRQMKAQSLVLTHFSQRYPKIPPVSSTSEDLESSNGQLPVVFAFDYMRLTPSTVIDASKITPALRLLYPEKDQEVCDENEAVIPDDALDVPGLFAQKELL